MGRIVPEGWAFVAAERKAIQSFRPADFTPAFGRAEARVARGVESPRLKPRGT